jgi:hypothetical protein
MNRIPRGWPFWALGLLIGCGSGGPTVPSPSSAPPPGKESVIEKADGKVPAKTGPTATLND